MIKLTLMHIKPTHRYFVASLSIALALLTAMSPFAIDTYLSAMPDMANYFGVGINLIEITLTLYFLGFALGNFIGGPLSDSFGRKKIALTGIILYGLAALLIPFTNSIYQVWGLRLIQAFGGGFASVTAMVFVKDLFQGKKVAKMATIIGMIMMLAPLFAPVIGGALLNIGSWKLIFFFLASFSLLLLLIFTFTIPETLPPEKQTGKLTASRFVKNYKLFFLNKRAVLLLFSLGFSISGMFTFITSASFIYLDYFNFNIEIFPLLFGANVVLNIVLSLLNNYFLKRHNPERMMQVGLLLQLFAGAMIFLAVLFLPNFWVIFSAIVLFIGSLGLVMGNGTALILNLTPKISGSANATIGVTRFIISFITGSIPALFHTGNLMPIGIVMFVCTVLGNLFYYFYKRKLELVDD